MDEVFPTQISAVHLDDLQWVTVQLQSGNYLRFQVDTGVQCNVIPLNLYEKANKDRNLTKVTPENANITACRGATLPVVGTAAIWVQRASTKAKLNCKLLIYSVLAREKCMSSDEYHIIFGQ